MKNVFVITIAILISVSAYGQAKKKEKDKLIVGKIFTIELTEVGKKKPKLIADEINFKSEKLNSKYTKAEYDIPSAVYAATVDTSGGEKIFSFAATGKNSWEEELKWIGTIKSDTIIEGTVVLSKKEKVKKEYSFNGFLKKKKVK